jgi:5'-nucleotidase
LRILVSNDDGYRAEGLQRLVAALEPLAEITVVAPERNRSGASNSLTLDVPLRVAEYGPRRYFVNGTPTDCVHLAISGLFADEHDQDMVVSGINDGANLGDDVLYSGTVAAAIEGRFLGLPAIAISLVVRDGRHFDTAARVASELLLRLRRLPLHSSMILVSATAIARRPWCARAIRAGARSTGWVRPARVPTRVPAPISMRWPPAMCR